MRKKSTVDLTQGVIWKQLLLFALPLLASSFIQQLYNTVDLLFVGNFIGKNASAAVGASSLLITCLVGFFSGMSVGSGVVMSQQVGARSEEGIRKTLHTAVALSFAGGILLTILGYIGAPLFLKWMNTPEEIIASAVSYVRIYFLSLTSVITYNIGSGVIRATGNSSAPMLIQLMGGIANVIMDAVFVVWFENGIDGVAWATLISQTTSAALALVYLFRQKGAYHLNFRKLKIYGTVLKEIIRVGIPAGIQSLVITLSNVFAQYHINGFNVDAIAAFTAYFKVELPIYLPIVAFGQAITIFSGQNIGAKNEERMRKGTRTCILMGIFITLIMMGIMLLFGRQAFRLFNKDEEVIAYGLRIIRISFPFYWVYVILEVLAASIRGAGKSVPPMAIILTNICIVRTLLLFVIMSFYHDVRGIALTYPITWGLTAVCMCLYYRYGKFVPHK